MRECAKYVVAVFFFLSAYGLIKSYSAKGKKYLSGFIRKRAVRLFIPMLPVILLLQVNNVFYGKIDVCHIARELLKGGTNDLCPNTWFVFVIFLFYVMFYLIAKICTSPKSLALILSGCVIVMTVGMKLTGCYEHVYLSNMGLISGLFVALTEQYIALYLNKRYKIALVVFGGIMLPFALNKAIPLFATLMMCAVFPFILYVVWRTTRVRTKILDYVGKYSYEIYITHGVLIVLFSQVNKPIITIPLVLFSVLPLSILVNRISKSIERTIKI